MFLFQQGDPNSYQASLRETAGLARNLDAIQIGGTGPASNSKGGDSGSAAGEHSCCCILILVFENSPSIRRQP